MGGAGAKLWRPAKGGREGEVKKKKALQPSRVCVAKNLELSVQSPERLMPTHEQANTDKHLQTSQCQTKQHTHSLTGSVAFKMDPFVSSSGAFVYLSVVSEAFDVMTSSV